MTDEYAARVHGEAVPRDRVETFLANGQAAPQRGAGLYRYAAPPRGATSHNGAADKQRQTAALTRERQRRRWATQVVVIDELARRTCEERGLTPPAEVSPTLVLKVAEADVADLGSIIAAALAHSPAARTLLAALEHEQHIPEEAVRDYYDRNRDRYLAPQALRRGVDPYAPTVAASDFLPYEQAREGIARELRTAAGRRAFFDWLDRARTAVEYAPGHEHPADPSHQDHEHRH